MKKVSVDNRYRLGVIDSADLWAIRYARFFRDHKKWLRSPNRMKISRYVDISRCHSFLEIGPQTGWRTLSSLAFSGQNVTALDHWGFYPAWRIYGDKVRFVIANADVSLPFQNSSFDHCVCMGALGYYSRPLQALKEVHRALKSGGYLFLSSNSKHGYTTTHGLLDSTITSLWDESQMRAFVSDAGFNVIELYRWVYPVLSRRDHWLYEVQKFVSLDSCERKKLDEFSGEEDYLYCIARKNPAYA